MKSENYYKHQAYDPENPKADTFGYTHPKVKVVITKGLPRSGKSTWSKKYVKEHKGWVRVSKDLVRKMLFGDANYGPSSDDYKEVDDVLSQKIRNAITLIAVGEGRNVIIDGMHLKENSIIGLKTLLRGKAKVTVRHFSAPLEVCLERNRLASDHRMSDEYIVSLSKEV